MSQGYDQSGSTEPVRASVRLGAPPGSSRRRRATDRDEPFIQLNLLRSLQLHRTMALIIALLGIALGVAYFVWFWPVYTAQSLVSVQPAPVRAADQAAGTRSPVDSSAYEAYVQQAMQNVTRTDVLTAALNKLGPGVWHPSGESEQSAIDRLRSAIIVTRVGNSYRFVIGAHASDPAIAARIANAVTASFIESAAHDQKAGGSERLAMLSTERDRVQKEMNADRAEQDELNKQLAANPIEATQVPNHSNDAEITRLRTELVKARTDHDAAAALNNAMDANHGPSSAAIDTEVDEMLSSDPTLANSRTTLTARRAALKKAMGNLALNPAEYKKDAAEVVQIDNQLDTMTKDLRARASSRVQAQIRADLERTSQAESQLNEQLRPLVEAATGSTSRKQRAIDLAADVLRLQTSFAAVDEQWHNLMIEDSSAGSPFQVTAAAVPVHPSKSLVARNTALIVLAGLLVAMLAAVVANKLDGRVYIGADVDRVVGYPPMAQLPDFREVSEGVAEEHLLRLAAALEHARQGGDLKRCIFTGAGAEAGVSTLVARLREMLAGMGRPTVVVDASSLPPPTRAEAEEDGEGTRGALRSSRTSALLQKMDAETEANEETLVLTDTAPLVVSAETEYLARFVDCVLVVIESGVSTRAELRAVAATLQRLNVPAVGFVLNRVGLKKADRAFRQSVQAIERHLYVQSLSTARRTVRTNVVKIAETVDTDQYASGSAARAQAKLAVAEPVARKTGSTVAETVSAAMRQAESDADRRAKARVSQSGPGPVDETAPHRSLRVVLDSSVEIAAFRSPPAVDAEAEHLLETPLRSEEASGADEAALPWWLDDLLSRSEANLAAAREEPPIVGEPLPGAGTVQRFPVPAHARSEKPAGQEWDAPPQSWEQVLSKFQAARNAEQVEEPKEEEVETTSSGLSSKLGGLRNLLFTMGMKRQNRATEQTASEETPSSAMEEPSKPVVEPAPKPVAEAPPKKPIVVRTITGSTETIVPAASAPVAATPKATVPVTPVPPTIIANERSRPEIAEDPASPRVIEPFVEEEGMTEPDDVQILPSWRGQYKKTK